MLFALLFLFFALLINFVSLFVCFPQYFHLIFVNFFISQPVFGNFPRQIARERGLQLDSASLHLAHGLRPLQFKTSGSSLAARFHSLHLAQVQDVRLKPCSSIPLPAQFKTSGSSLAARFRFAPSRSRAAPASVQDVRLKPCSSIPLHSISLTGCARFSSRRPAQALQLDSASLHLAHGLRPIQEKRRSPLFVRARQMASPFFLCMA